MENPNSEGNYEEAKQKAKEFYQKIDRVWSPALNEYIAFKSSGFRHLIWKGALARPKSEQRHRFALLPHVIAIFQNPDAMVTTKEEKGARFLAFTEKQDGKMIRAVVRQIGNQEKHFFSIFEEKQKSANANE